ncbi:hypothetical protein B9Z55_007772 [Caenorhabditis nigoni]|uniref:Uncharacterized protein n=1 Tax=Caenorhabditis nigoni TaxID=1611254 RepID=A0A2G5VBU7_9PELO|nr:hypothetical protein B9Z55_007772 [Caenorhabditis nigoni]
MLDVRRSQIASIATILEGHVNILTVFKWENEENWWQHRLVKNAKELITECSPLMLRNSENKIIRFHNPGVLRTEEYCELIDSWMSVKREPGAELWIGLYFKKHRNDILEMMQTRMEVVGLEERCVRMRAEMEDRSKYLKKCVWTKQWLTVWR